MTLDAPFLVEVIPPAKEPKRRPQTFFPVGWEPGEKERDIAIAAGLKTQEARRREWMRFESYWLSTGKKKANWLQCWRNWSLNATGGGRYGRSSQPQRSGYAKMLGVGNDD